MASCFCASKFLRRKLTKCKSQVGSHPRAAAGSLLTWLAGACVFMDVKAVLCRALICLVSSRPPLLGACMDMCHHMLSYHVMCKGFSVCFFPGPVCMCVRVLDVCVCAVVFSCLFCEYVGGVVESTEHCSLLSKILSATLSSPLKMTTTSDVKRTTWALHVM